ncbi:MAG: hypothetical protein LBQ15_05615 [Clostridium sp.]|nr:hypothetical protein [Clostridium sp.]
MGICTHKTIDGKLVRKRESHPALPDGKICKSMSLFREPERLCDKLLLSTGG